MKTSLRANWRTSTTGLIETSCLIAIALAVFPHEVWEKPSSWIPAVVLVVAKTVKDFVTKDKDITGGSKANGSEALSLTQIRQEHREDTDVYS